MIDEIMGPQMSVGITLQLYLQCTRSLTSESRKRNVGGEVLAVRFGGQDETFGGPAFRTILITGFGRW